MEKKELLQQLKEYKISNNPYIIDKIIYDLEQDNKTPHQDLMIHDMQKIDMIYSNDDIYFSDNDKSRAIHKLLISNRINGKTDLLGYRLNKKKQMEITDAYRAFIINKFDTPYHESSTIPDIAAFIKKAIGTGKNKLSKYRKIMLDVDSIEKQYQKMIDTHTSSYLYILKNGVDKVIVNLYFLKDTIDVLGKEVTCYIPTCDGKPLYFCNSSNEEGMLCPVKCYDDEDILNRNTEEQIFTESPNDSLANENSLYKIMYQDENLIKKQLRNLKKYNIRAYKIWVFTYLPALKNGEFIGDIVSKDDINTIHYELSLPTDPLFTKVYGKTKLYYVVYKDQKVIGLEKFTPEDILSNDHHSELETYKGVMVSKENRDKDIFKIDLLNMIRKD